MIKRLIITTILTGLLIGIPYLILKNYEGSLQRRKELNSVFKKLESQEIESIRLTIRDNSDSLLVDSAMVDEVFCRKLRQSILKLQDDSGPPSRRISNRTFYLDIVIRGQDHISIEVYITKITALVLIKTKSRDWADGLDDLYSSLGMKSLLEDI